MRLIILCLFLFNSIIVSGQKKIKICFVFDSEISSNEIESIREDYFGFVEKSKRLSKKVNFTVIRSDYNNLEEFDPSKNIYQAVALCDYRDKSSLLTRFQKRIASIENNGYKFYKVEGSSISASNINDIAEKIQKKIKERKFESNIYLYFKSSDKQPIELKVSKNNVNVGEPIELSLENVSNGGVFRWGDNQTKSNSYTYFPTKSETFIASYKKEAVCKADSFMHELKVIECPCAMSVKWDYTMDKKISDFDPSSGVYGLYPDKATGKYYILCNNTCGIDYINVELIYAEDDVSMQTRKLSWKFKYTDIIKSQETITSPIFNQFPDAIAIPISPNKLIDWEDGKGYGFIYQLKISQVMQNGSIYYCDGESVVPNVYKVKLSYCPF